jgi:hypothetical protein
MADYKCFPLWEASPGVVGNINPQDLPISWPLKQELMAWAAKFDATLDIDNPVSSGFKNEELANQFQQEGEILAQRLQEELRATCVVTKKL